MAPQKFKKGKEIDLRGSNTKEPLTLSQEACYWLEELNAACLYNDLGYMTFPRTTTGGKSYTFFVDEDKVKWYLACTDDPEQEVTTVLDYLFGAQVVAQARANVRARLARKAAAASKPPQA